MLNQKELRKTSSEGRRIELTIKIVVFLLISLLDSLGLYAQQGSVASGGDAANSSGSISYSLGRIDYASVTNSTGAINAGVQQPYEIFVSSINDAYLEWTIELFPNPANNDLNIRVSEQNENLLFRLLDLNGRVLLESMISYPLSLVNMQELPSAVYNLQLLDGDKNIKTFKVIKK